MQAKDRELAEAQQQLRKKVNGVKCLNHVSCVTDALLPRRQS